MLRLRREVAWEKHIWATYKLTAENYWRIHKKQAGVCALCKRATGRPRDASAKNRAKRLSVDHRHSCCPTTPTCGQCTSGLLCRPCNRLLGHFRDDAETFLRAVEYLRNPPAREIIRA